MMFTVRRCGSVTAILCGLLGQLSAADLIADGDIPDPFGLGPRLALIDLLKEEFKVQPPAGATLQQLKEMHAKEVAKRKPAVEETAAGQLRLRELTVELRDVYGVEVAESDTVATLEALLALKQKEDAELQQRAEKSGAVPVPAATLPAEVAAGPVPRWNPGKPRQVIVGQAQVTIRLPENFEGLELQVLRQRFPSLKGDYKVFAAVNNPWSCNILVNEVSTRIMPNQLARFAVVFERIYKPLAVKWGGRMPKSINGRDWYQIRFDSRTKDGVIFSNVISFTSFGGKLFSINITGPQAHMAANKDVLLGAVLSTVVKPRS